MFYDFQVLNETSLWWFDKTRHISPNAVVLTPDENVTIAKKCSVFPVEFVGTSFLTYHFSFSIYFVSYFTFIENVVTFEQKLLVELILYGKVIPEVMVKIIFKSGF